MISLLLAGLGHLVLHFGIGAVLIALCIFGAIYSPVGKKDFIYAAFCVALALTFWLVGVKDEKRRVAAQEHVVQINVDKAVAKTKTPNAKKSKDPWDRPNY